MNENESKKQSFKIGDTFGNLIVVEKCQEEKK